MRLSRAATLASAAALTSALWLLAPNALNAAELPRPGITGMKGVTVTPRTVEFSALPPLLQVPAGPDIPVKEGVWEEGEEEVERLKAHPFVIRASELSRTPGVSRVTLDSGGGGFSPMAPTPGNGFEGIIKQGYIPSEPTVAAGPLNIFSAGNISVTVTNKDGTNRVVTGGLTFFGAPGFETAISDPQCFYDAVHGRFVAIAFTQVAASSISHFYLAISKTNDARGAWWLYQFDMTRDGTTPTSNWGDYEAVGISENKLAMSCQMFTFSSNSYQYQKIRVIDRALAYAGSPVTYVDFFNFPPPPGGSTSDLFVTKVARNMTAGDSTIHCYNVRTGGGSRITYRTITGPPSSPTLSTGDFVTVSSYTVPPDAVQKNSVNLVATNDCRPTDWYVRNGILYGTWHTGITYNVQQVSAVRLMRMRTSDRAVLTDETFGQDSVFYYYPAVTADSLGTIFLGFDRSSVNDYPSAWATGKRRSDASLQSSVLLKTGSNSTGDLRWGDYTGIDMDASLCTPSGSTAWYAGQWMKSTIWGTWINRLTFSYGVVSGRVFDDCDGSAGTAGDRAPLAGVSVALKQGVTTLATATTDGGGAYSFGYNESGTYDVVVTPPAGGSAVDALPGTGGTSQTRISATDLQVAITNAQTSINDDFLVTSTHASPATAGIVPATKTVGDPGFTMTVNGSAFVQCAVVRLDGSDRPTTWVSAAQLSADIPASTMSAPGSHEIKVFNPAPGGGLSNAQTFTVTPDVTPPTVAVTSPVGGETWKAGSTHAITWTASDNLAVTSIDLALSTDGGATFPTVIATGEANDGTFSWSVPNTPSATARVRVTAHDAAANAGSDSSHANFTIDRWVITASAGPGGAIAPSGAVGVVEGGDQGFTITPNAGNHVTNVLVDGGSVGAVTAYNFTAVTANHTIAASFGDSTGPAVQVLTPNGGESATVGASFKLAWSATDNVGVTLVDLLLSRSGAIGPFDSLAFGLANTGTYDWTTTGPATTNAFLKVVAHDSSGNSGADLSDASFEIVDVTGVEGGPVTDFELPAVWPNPVRVRCGIGFAVPRAATVRLSVLDVQGREVAVLADGVYPEGRHRVEWNASGRGASQPGIYFVRMTAGGRTLVRRFVLMR